MLHGDRVESEITCYMGDRVESEIRVSRVRLIIVRVHGY